MSLTADRVAVEKAAGAIAHAACESSFLARGDPLGLVTPHLESLEHSLVCQVATTLLKRFQDTVVGHVPPLEALAAAVSQLALPVLARLEACCCKHRAFQSAFTLAPLMRRVCTVAAQCCSLAVFDVGDTSVTLPVLCSVRELAEVLSGAVLDRAERYRPMDAHRIAAAHQAFDIQQAELSAALRQALGEQGVEGRARSRRLEPLPERPVHRWKNEELRQFWEALCAPKYDNSVPSDVLATLLLRHAGIGVTMANREAVMRRLAKLDLKERLMVAPGDLDRCGAESRRVGGLRAWVTAITTEGADAAAARVGPVAVQPPAMASTWSSLDTTAYRMTVTSLGHGAPTSARTTASAAFQTPREKGICKIKSADATALPTPRSGAAASSPRWTRRPLVSARGSEPDPLLDSVEKHSLKASQRLIFGDKVAVDVRAGLFSETPLHAAALRDRKHAPVASMLLEGGADVHAEDRHKATPLHFAASAGNKEVARKLVGRGADVCKEDRWSVTPLHKAASNGQATLVELLLDSGANATAADEWGSTPLHRAVARGQLFVAEKLLAASGGAADANATDRAGECPLHMAASRGDYAMVKLLLEHGAHATVRSRLAGKLPEDYARERGHGDVVTLLQNRREWVIPRSSALQVAGS